MPEADPVLGPMVGLHTVKAVLWRSRRVWLFTALLGLLVGVSLHLVIPHKVVAVTDLYLAEPAGADPTTAMADNVSLLHTELVAEQAITTHHLDMSPDALLSHYTGLALSDNIMSIKFSGKSQTDATSSDNAIAQAFLAVLARELRLQTDVLVRGLQSQISSLNAEISNLNVSINGLSSAPPNSQTTDQLTELVNQRGSDATQISQFQSQIQQALLNQKSTDDVSHVLDPAAVIPASTKKVILEDGLSGLVAGLAVGLAGVALKFLLSEPRPDRSTVAATLGAPVELSLGRYKTPRVMRRSRLSRQLTQPNSDVCMIERRLRGHLESAPGSALAVVAMGTAEPAALAVGALALTLCSEGRQVVVVDASENRLLAFALGLTSKPLQTMEAFQLPALGSSSVTVLVAPKDPLQMAQKPPPDDADVVLVLAALDPAFGAEHLASWVTDAVMILTASEVTLPRMEVSRVMLREAGISLRSAILLGSDPMDDSSATPGPADLRVTAVESSGLSK